MRKRLRLGRNRRVSLFRWESLWRGFPGRMPSGDSAATSVADSTSPEGTMATTFRPGRPRIRPPAFFCASDFFLPVLLPNRELYFAVPLVAGPQTDAGWLGDPRRPFFAHPTGFGVAHCWLGRLPPAAGRGRRRWCEDNGAGRPSLLLMVRSFRTANPPLRTYRLPVGSPSAPPRGG
jgi:hypothetical protein